MSLTKRGALLTSALLGLSLLPPVQVRGKAALVLIEALGATVPRPLAPDVERAESDLGGVSGDIYTSRSGAPGILLLPGAAPKGKDDPRVVRLAGALARAGRTVFVPTLRLSETRLDPRDVEDIVTATEALSERTARRVTILGISYGGSFGLIAAADPRLHDRLELVAVFGAYFDLRGLIQAASTGVSLVGDRRIPWEGDPRAREVLQNAATELVPPGQRDALTTALTNDDGIADLEPEARAVYELVTNDDPAATFALAGRLGDHATRIIEGSSPASVAGSLQVPVIALHSTDDPVTPYGEAVRLEAEMPEARLVTVSLFQHVDLEGASLPAMFPDLVRTWRFTSWVLRSQS